MIPDSPSARSSDTALRDLLRRLDRYMVGSRPARPSAPPPEPAPLIGFAALEPTPVLRVGQWAFTEDNNGDLVATHDQTGVTTVIARKDGA